MKAIPAAARAPIRILPDTVVNQIAAGEVIERPAAVVKELLENSLDAGARRIDIEFVGGGKHVIRIEDDGCGMSADEALLALERHATSKLREAVDLNTVRTLGFRGEALPSIASVSRFTLQSRRPEAEAGTELVVNAGRIVRQAVCGRAQGTRIEVAQLFNSVPARRKFLKTDATEAAHIIHLVRLHAVARPEVAMTLLEDGRTVFRSPACPSMQDRVREIWGASAAQGLIELPEAAGPDGFALRGLIGPPGNGRSSRRDMVTLVNGRPVDSRTLAYAAIEAYHTHLPRGRYPQVFLFLEIDPAAIDVNIHPAKREIRFRNEGTVRRGVMEALSKALDGHSRRHWSALPRKSLGDDASPQQPPVPEPVASTVPARQPEPKAFPAPHPATPFPQSTAQVPQSECAPAEPPSPAFRPRTVPTEARGQAERWRYIGQALEVYALFEAPGGLVIVHPGHAHERVCYERVRAHFEGERAPVQTLLLPVNFDFEPLAAAALEPWLSLLAENGLPLERFGRNFYRLTAHPEWLPEAEVRGFVTDLVSRIRDGSVPAGRALALHEAAARVAASRSARAKDYATSASLEALVDALLRCQQPLTSPAGKPTLQELSRAELSRRFAL